MISVLNRLLPLNGNKQVLGVLLLISIFASCKVKESASIIPADVVVNGQYLRHIVREGESLRKLSKRYKTSKGEIKSLNPKLDLNEKLLPGTEIMLLNQ